MAADPSTQASLPQAMFRLHALHANPVVPAPRARRGDGRGAANMSENGILHKEKACLPGALPLKLGRIEMRRPAATSGRPIGRRFGGWPPLFSNPETKARQECCWS